MSATAEAISVGPGFFHEAMPLAQLQPSPLNPRKRFDDLESLADSIKTLGVLEPLLARPVGDHYELVFGERRYRAALLAGVTTAPVTVRHLSDAQALEIMVVENNQRKDVNALEEADGFSRLLQAGAYDAVRLAARIGRSKKYVYDRVKLLDLVPAAQQLVLDGRITASHAILLARLTPEDQARAIDPAGRALFEFDNFGIADRAELTTPDPYANAHPLSVREFEGWIDEHVRLDLAAPVDADLFPEAAIAQEQADVRRVVFLTTYDFYVDAAGDVLCAGSWRRADGTQGQDVEGRPITFETCDRSLLGVVVIGPERGTTFPVCVDRACDIHWPPARESRRTAGARPAEAEAEAGTALAREREDWDRAQERKRGEIARYTQLAPKLRKVFLQRINALKEPALVAFMLRHHDMRKDLEGLPKGSNAIAVVRRLIVSQVDFAIENSWSAPVQVPTLAKTLGVDLKPLLKDDAKPVQTSAQKKKPAAKKKKR